MFTNDSSDVNDVDKVGEHYILKLDTEAGKLIVPPRSFSTLQPAASMPSDWKTNITESMYEFSLLEAEWQVYILTCRAGVQKLSVLLATAFWAIIQTPAYLAVD